MKRRGGSRALTDEATQQRANQKRERQARYRKQPGWIRQYSIIIRIARRIRNGIPRRDIGATGDDMGPEEHWVIFRLFPTTNTTNLRLLEERRISRNKGHSTSTWECEKRYSLIVRRSQELFLWTPGFALSRWCNFGISNLPSHRGSGAVLLLPSGDIAIVYHVWTSFSHTDPMRHRWSFKFSYAVYTQALTVLLYPGHGLDSGQLRELRKHAARAPSDLRALGHPVPRAFFQCPHEGAPDDDGEVGDHPSCEAGETAVAEHDDGTEAEIERLEQELRDLDRD
jgi:hypothetical protein